MRRTAPDASASLTRSVANFGATSSTTTSPAAAFKMKPFKEKLSEQEIDALVKYIRGMKGK